MSQKYQRLRNFCFTINNWTKEDEDLALRCSWSYIIFGYEVGDSQTPHIQGYCELEEQRAFNTVKKFFPRAHIQDRLGTAKEASDYCKKDGNFKELGTLSNQGGRKDLEKLKNDIMLGKEIDEIILESPILYHQYGRTLEKIEDIRNRKKFRNFMTKGIWIYGPTGVGKSHYACNTYAPNKEDRYIHNMGDKGWWDNYRGEKVCIFNEFRGQIAYGELLDLCDKWEKSVSRRGRPPMPFVSETIIITSSLPPAEVYKNLSKEDSLEQLYRRFEVIRMTPNEDLRTDENNLLESSEITQKSSEGNTGASESCLLEDEPELKELKGKMLRRIKEI